MIRAAMPFEEIVDSFAGGGGAGLGIQRALGRSAGVAINHDQAALTMYGRNHPDTLTLLEDVWRADLNAAIDHKPVGLLWASPDCKHFSRAKGGKPVEKNIRSLAWVLVRWADQVKPRVIILENVREFADWGPVVPKWKCRSCEWVGTEGQARLARIRLRCPRCNSLSIGVVRIECKRTGQLVDALVPDPKRKGLTFRRWVGRLRNLGYAIEWRNLNAADYGAPTHRRRLFLVARCDDQPITWPEPTHCAPSKVQATPLFAPLKPWRTAAECIDWHLPCPSIFDRKRPLAEKTQHRIAEAMRRYVLENPTPYIVGVGGRMGQTTAAPTDQPSNTITAKNDRAVIVPTLVPLTHSGGEKRVNSVEDPLPTITTAKRGEIALVSATMIQSGYGERDGQAPRALDLGKPLGTIVAGGNKHQLVMAFMVKHFGGVYGVPIDTPAPTITARGTQNQLAIASLIHLNHGEKQWSGVDEPMRTVTTGKHAALVYAFLIRYFGTAIGQHVTDPLYTITGKDRFGLVTVTIDGEPWHIIDIGMRMLTPRELARCQGFDESYVLTGSKTQQVARIGNSVPPPLAEAIVRANCADLALEAAR